MSNSNVWIPNDFKNQADNYQKILDLKKRTDAFRFFSMTQPEIIETKKTRIPKSKKYVWDVICRYRFKT